MARRQGVLLGIGARRFVGGFGEQSSYLRGLIMMASRMGMRAFVFEPGSIDFENRTIRGWAYGKRGWFRKQYPWPDVIYDRVWGISSAQKDRYDADLARLWTQGRVPSFNPRFEGKLELHQIMAESLDLIPHLPRTLALDEDNVELLGREFPTLFVKPVHGRQGKRISLCVKTKDGWRIKRRLKDGSTRLSLARTPAQLVTHCAGRSSPNTFLVQQGLDLVRVAGGTVDIRVIAQRDKSGTWSVTGIGARVGAKGGFVSNLHAGGRAYSLKQLCQHRSIRMSSRQLASQISRLVLTTVNHLTNHLPFLGEVGLDIGLDTDGRLWILEVNRQPGRALFARARLYKSWRLSRVRIIQFASYLAKAGIESHSPLGPRSYDGP